jgi:DnaK suppressor protein
MSKTTATKTKTAGKRSKAAKAVDPTTDGQPAEAPAARTPPAKGVVATYVQRNPRPVEVVESDDGDDEGNLLTGPRNVQPYIAKRGEQYMSREQLDHFRTILESWKRDLMVEVDRTVSHMKDEAANFPDPNDRATQEEEFSLELRTRDRERKLIRKIEEALARIEDGSYGYCLETGEEIGIKRLEARPVATLSLEAQERRERREKQYGDRDDRYR